MESIFSSPEQLPKMSEYTSFTKVQDHELSKIRDSLEKIGNAQSEAKKLKESIGFEHVIQNAEVRLDNIMKLKKTISELKVKLYIRMFTTIKGGSRRAEKSRKVLMMMLAAKMLADVGCQNVMGRKWWKQNAVGVRANEVEIWVDVVSLTRYPSMLNFSYVVVICLNTSIFKI